MRRNIVLDIAKGLAIILVMYAHSCGMPFGTTQYIISFYMPLFFLISGYLWHHNESGFNAYLRTKCRKIAVPYFCMSIFLFCFFWLRHMIDGQELKSIIGVIYGSYALYFRRRTGNIYFFNIDNAPMWFLTTYFSASLMLYVYRQIMSRYKIKEWIGMTALLGIAYLATFLPIYLPWGMDIAFLSCFFMEIGRIVRNRNIKLKWQYFILLPVFLMLVRINPNPNMGTREYGDFPVANILIFVCTSLIGSAIFLLISRGLSKHFVGRVLALVGAESMWLLMTHLFLFRLFDFYTRDSFTLIKTHDMEWGTIRIMFVTCLVTMLRTLAHTLRRTGFGLYKKIPHLFD